MNNFKTVTEIRKKYKVLEMETMTDLKKMYPMRKYEYENKTILYCSIFNL